MARKPHPVDERDAEIIAEAIGFRIAVFLGAGRYARAEAETLDAARSEANRLQSENPGRRAMIYGVNAAGRSALLTPATEALMAAKKTPAKKTIPANKRRKAQGLRGGKRTAAKAAATARAPKQRAPATPQIAPIEGMAPLGAKPAAPVSLEAKRWDNAAFTDDQLTVILAAITKRPPAKKAPRDLREQTIAAAAKNGVSVSDARAIIKRAMAPTGAAAAKAKQAPRKTAAAKSSGGGSKLRGRFAEMEEQARKGKLPPAPDFSAPTHERYRGKLAELVAMAKAGDVKALKAFPINVTSSSPRALDRYRNLCVLALEAKGRKQ